MNKSDKILNQARPVEIDGHTVNVITSAMANLAVCLACDEALSNLWKDASKELPFPHEEVYVLDSEGFPDIGFHEQNGAWKTRGSLRLEKIKYWMPIPPAPRKENIK